jgi:hypothetical protein
MIIAVHLFTLASQCLELSFLTHHNRYHLKKADDMLGRYENTFSNSSSLDSRCIDRIFSTMMAADGYSIESDTEQELNQSSLKR